MKMTEHILLIWSAYESTRNKQASGKPQHLCRSTPFEIRINFGMKIHLYENNNNKKLTQSMIHCVLCVCALVFPKLLSWGWRDWSGVCRRDFPGLSNWLQLRWMLQLCDSVVSIVCLGMNGMLLSGLIDCDRAHEMCLEMSLFVFCAFSIYDLIPFSLSSFPLSVTVYDLHFLTLSLRFYCSDPFPSWNIASTSKTADFKFTNVKK